MEPGLQNDGTILIDRACKQVRRCAVIAARVSNDLFVKRLKQTPDGKWTLSVG